jgi:FkbM family methyltransferase
MYKTKYGDLFWLNDISYVDKCVKNNSVWELTSTNRMKSIVKQGDIVLDIGANFGYYSVLMSKIVGNQGRVLAFEPTQLYGKVLKQNIEINKIENVTVFDYGLSDKETEAEIGIEENSATLHWVEEPIGKEKISLKRLDSIIDSLQLNKIDFIKIDVDGHEPAFLQGAWNTIDKYKPVILLEVSHKNYLKAGITAWDFYNDLKNRSFHLYSEKTMIEYDLDTFLYDCGNFNRGANLIIKCE